MKIETGSFFFELNLDGCRERSYSLKDFSEISDSEKTKVEYLTAKCYCSPGYRFAISPAGHTCFICFRKGSGTLIYDGVTYHPKAGDFFLLHKGHDWEFFTDKKDLWETIWLNAYPTTVDAAISYYHLEDVVAIPPKNWEKDMETIYEIIAHSSETVYEKRERVARALFSMISDIYRAVVLPKAETKQEKDAILMKNYIDEHACEPLTVPEISRLVLRSTSRATTIFKSFFGFSLKQYILQAKFKLAERYLLDGKLSVDEISNALSFCSTQHFSQSFRKNYGCSPSQFQKRFRKSKK